MSNETRLKEELESTAKTSTEKRKFYLKKQENELADKVFYRLGRDDKKKNNAVNDFMSCMQIADSKPVDVSCLVSCQKIDLSPGGNKNSLNIMRECIRPNTKLEFDLTLTEKFPYTIEQLLAAIKEFSMEYEKNFFSKYHVQKIGLHKPTANTVWLGGGAGYVSKTVVYPFLGYTKGLKTVSSIMQKTVSDGYKKHGNDWKNGVSPHMLKCTEYRGAMYEFGRCEIKIKER